MVKIQINKDEYEVDDGITLIQACEQVGIEIPRFCYHEKLKIAGNCRMCLVEIEGGPPKPIASCSTNIIEGMKVHTNSPMVKKARAGVLEFLLINHPLDCPICDQGGECDLQDQALFYGTGKSRFSGAEKRAVSDKNLGPLIKTHMTRCIHCTRCIRFMQDIAGVPEMGIIGRGEQVEVTTYLNKGLTSELSGNIIDLCPVGALTSKSYAFRARSWELTKTESIDVFDAVGSNIRIDHKGEEVLRILPSFNDDINEEWISDKSRFAYDGLKYQRIDQAYIKINDKDKKYKEISVDEAIAEICIKLKALKGKEIGALAGDMADVESMYILRKIMHSLDSYNLDCRLLNSEIDYTNRGNYLFNSKLNGIEEADLCLIIGSNIRLEASILNSRIRKAYLENNLPIALIGEEVDLTYPVTYLDNDISIIYKIAKGEHDFCKLLEKAKKPMIIVGENVFSHRESLMIKKYFSTLIKNYNIIYDGWNGFNLLTSVAARVGGLDIGFVPNKEKKGLDFRKMLLAAKSHKLKLLFLLGKDDINIDKVKDEVFIVYIGSHGDKGAHQADIILPASAYTEKESLYVNLEGRVQSTRKAVKSPGNAQEDYKLLLKIASEFKILDKDLTLDQLRKLIAEDNDIFDIANYNKVTDNKLEIVTEDCNLEEKTGILSNIIDNFYQTDPISRHSKAMAKCVQELLRNNKQ